MRGRPWVYGFAICFASFVLSYIFFSGFAQRADRWGDFSPESETTNSSHAAGVRAPADSGGGEVATSAKGSLVLNDQQFLERQSEQYAALRFHDSGLDAFAIPIASRGSCRIDAQNEISFGDLVASRLKLDRGQSPLGQGDQLSEHHHIEEAALFFKHGNQYIQLIANVAGGKPAAYRVTGYAFSDEFFSSNPSIFTHALFKSDELYDVAAVREIFDGMRTEFKEARVYQRLSLLENGGHSRISVRFFGRLPVTMQSKGEECSLDTVKQNVTCLCSFVEEE